MTEIKPGSLVYVAKPAPCCNCTDWIGLVYTVTGFESAAVCEECHTELIEPSVQVNNNFALPIRMVRPLRGDLSHVTEHEELTA